MGHIHYGSFILGDSQRALHLSLPPSLCTKLICLALALIIYSECGWREVSSFCWLDSPSVASFSLPVFSFIMQRIHFTPCRSFSSCLLFVFFSFALFLQFFSSAITWRSDSPHSCCCAAVLLPDKREFFFHVCPTPIIMPSETDGSPGKQRSCWNTLLASQC